MLSVVGLQPFEGGDPINAGVTADELVAAATGGEVLRRVTFKDIISGEVYEFLTNVLDKNVAPGLIAFLYRSRWGIEKSFDEFKNKLGEQKAWASSSTAKGMQAQFLCLTMNLLTLLEHQLATQEDIRNRPEEQRRAKRLDKDKAKAAEQNTVLPQALLLVHRITQIGVKLIRWVACPPMARCPLEAGLHGSPQALPRPLAAELWTPLTFYLLSLSFPVRLPGLRTRAGALDPRVVAFTRLVRGWHAGERIAASAAVWVGRGGG